MTHTLQMNYLEVIMKDSELSDNKKNPVISIIMPVYHVEKYLRRALDSILGQSFADFELILVNDGGNEEESAICREYAQRDSRIIYLTQENQGLSAARNRGLEAHRGKWIMFADSDDWVREDFCEKALQSVVATDSDMGIFDLAYTMGNATEGQPHCVELPEGVYDSNTILEGRLRGTVPCYAWNKIYREELWNDIRFPVGECWEDDAIIHEVIDKAKSIAIIHDVLYYKPYRDNCITSEAARDYSDVYWLCRQRRRRWEYLEQHHPEMLPLEEEGMVNLIILYAKVSLLLTNKPEGYEEVLCWAKKAQVPLGKVRRTQRIRYYTFLHSKGLFILQERLITNLKKLKRPAK